jgi:hypothetical protein
MSSSNGQQPVHNPEQAAAHNEKYPSSTDPSQALLQGSQAWQLPAIQLQLNTSRTATGGASSRACGTAINVMYLCCIALSAVKTRF